jgi:hypothetical protein
VGMVLIVFCVFIALIYERVTQMTRFHLSAQDLASRVEAQEALQIHQAADHFKNLFEVPVLFYLLCVVSYSISYTPEMLLYGAWGFVGLRALQAFIHCTYNNVKHRAAMFFGSSFLLFIMWVLVAIRLVSMVKAAACMGCMI